MNTFMIRVLPLVLAVAGLAIPAPAAASAHITVVNVDGPGRRVQRSDAGGAGRR